MKVHLDNHIENKQNLPCPLCQQLFSNDNDIKRHINAKHNQDYTLAMIQKARIQIQPPTDRKRNVYTEKIDYEKIDYRYKCLICNLMASSKQSLLVHLDLHNNIKKTFPCPMCNQNFICEKYVQSHILSKHNLRYTYEMIQSERKSSVEANVGADENADCVYKEGKD